MEIKSFNNIQQEKILLKEKNSEKPESENLSVSALNNDQTEVFMAKSGNADAEFTLDEHLNEEEINSVKNKLLYTNITEPNLLSVTVRKGDFASQSLKNIIDQHFSGKRTYISTILRLNPSLELDSDGRFSSDCKIILPIHTVRSGENISSISSFYGVSDYNELVSLNNLKKEEKNGIINVKIQINQQLILPQDMKLDNGIESILRNSTYVIPSGSDYRVVRSAIASAAEESIGNKYHDKVIDGIKLGNNACAYAVSEMMPEAGDLDDIQEISCVKLRENLLKNSFNKVSKDYQHGDIVFFTPSHVGVIFKEDNETYVIHNSSSKDEVVKIKLEYLQKSMTVTDVLRYGK